MLDRLARAGLVPMHGLAGDREDAARRADALEAVLDLAPPQGDDPQQGLQAVAARGGELRPLATASAFSSQDGGFEESAFVHVKKANRLFK